MIRRSRSLGARVPWRSPVNIAVSNEPLRAPGCCGITARRPNPFVYFDVTSQETFPATPGSNRSNALPAAASSAVCSSTVKFGRERRPRFRRWLVIWVRVETTQEEIALITQAARKTGPHSVPIRHTRSCKPAQQAEVAQGRRSHPPIARKDEAVSSETEVSIDIRLSYRLQSKIVIAEMHSHSHPVYHSANHSIIQAANRRRRGK